MDICPHDNTMLSGRTVMVASTGALIEVAWCWRCKRAWPLEDDTKVGVVTDPAGTWRRALNT